MLWNYLLNSWKTGAIIGRGHDIFSILFPVSLRSKPRNFSECSESIYTCHMRSLENTDALFAHRFLLFTYVHYWEREFGITLWKPNSSQLLNREHSYKVLVYFTISVICNIFWWSILIVSWKGLIFSLNIDTRMYKWHQHQHITGDCLPVAHEPDFVAEVLYCVVYLLDKVEVGFSLRICWGWKCNYSFLLIILCCNLMLWWTIFLCMLVAEIPWWVLLSITKQEKIFQMRYTKSFLLLGPSVQVLKVFDRFVIFVKDTHVP